MRKKKQSNLSRLLEYAGSYKKLTVLGCALSGVAALLSLLPFLCIWLVVRQVFEVMPGWPSGLQ